MPTAVTDSRERKAPVSRAPSVCIPEGEHTFLSLGSLLDYAAVEHGLRVALIWREGADRRSLTYRELSRNVANIGAGLIARGLEKGDRVAILAENGPEWAESYLAAVSAGAVAVPLDTQLRAADLRQLLAHCEARFVVVSPGACSETVSELDLPGVTTIATGAVRPHGASLLIREAAAIGKLVVAGGNQSFHVRRASTRPDDVAVICYTSGTTGRPKGVTLLHRNLIADADGCRRRLPFAHTDIFLCLLPLYHTYAATTTMLAPIAVGASIVFGRSLKSRDIREDIEREGVTVMVGVPLLYEHMARGFMKRICELPARRRLPFRAAYGCAAAAERVLKRRIGRRLFGETLSAAGLGTLRMCISGAAALGPEVESTLSTLGLPILQGYGLTEAAPVVSVNPLDRPKKGTLGPPLPGVEVRIHGPGRDGVGEIAVRGQNVMAGYYRDAGETAAVIRDGWLYTGDLGSVDAEGYLRFAGRRKSIIVTAGGKNIYPEEIEAILNESPCILESIVLPLKDGAGNDLVAAIVVPEWDQLAGHPECRGGVSDDSARRAIGSEIRRLSAGLPEYKRIREFAVRRDEFPKTSTRKIKRHLVMWHER